MDSTGTGVTTAVTSAASAARGFAEQTPGEQAFSLLIFGLGTAVSGAFLYYLITDPTRLAQAWEWTRSLPLLVQALVWLLFLPWMLCLWVWALPWALPIRLVLVLAALAGTTWLLWPWK